jgi:predicted enzyme related to lactoylglutathione lyase
MANFVLLYTGGGMPETEAEQAAVMQAWTTWYGQLGSAVVDGGNPFTPVAKRIASNGTVSDGPVGTMATGPNFAEWWPDFGLRNLPGDVVRAWRKQ